MFGLARRGTRRGSKGAGSPGDDMDDGRARIAVIGCGAWGTNHIRTLAQLGYLAAVADERGERSFEVAAEFGVPPLAPGQVMDSPEIDGVVLALPAELHAPMAIEALERGKHVLAEKPLALTAAEGERAVGAARAAGRTLMVGHVLRHHPAFRTLHDTVRDGVIGEVRYVQSHRQGFGRFHASFDAAWDLAPHDLSLVLAITGEPPDLAVARGTAALAPSRDTALIYMTFPSGIGAHVVVSRTDPVRLRRFTVTGTTGSLVFDDLREGTEKLALYRHSLSQNPGGGHSFELGDPVYLPFPEGMPLLEELRNFAAAIEGKAEPLTPGEDGVEVVRILERTLPMDG